MKEVWKVIPGYDGHYEVSNLGRVRSSGYQGDSPKVCIRKPYQKKNGYLHLGLTLPHTDGGRGKRKMHYVHRLVAQMFIPNPENKPEVNHIDGNKTNNKVDNLEWATRLENDSHSRYILGRTPKNPRCRAVRCVETGVVYPSLLAAQRATGIWDGNIGSAAQHRRRRVGNRFTTVATAGGFHWEYC